MRLALGKLTAAALVAGGLAITLAGCGSTTGQGTAANGSVTLNETGSSLLYPLFQNVWIPAYTKGTSIRINASSTGSGTGIADATNGTVQIGGSDAYMSDAQLAGTKGILNIPLAISAQQIMYNVPGLNNQHLRLSGPILAGIYTGQITNWDAPQIAAANPGVHFPNLHIVPIHRADGSGDTFLFTQYLSFSNPSSWGSTKGPQYGTAISWPPVQGSVNATGNAGMVQALQQNTGGIAYVGISYLSQAVKAGLGYAELLNRAGQYVLPTQQTISAAAQAMYPATPKDERVSLIFAPGAQSYPIINYEYAIVQKNQPNPATAKALREFLDWTVTPSFGNAPTYLNQVHFLPLPSSVATLSQSQISEIQ